MTFFYHLFTINRLPVALLLALICAWPVQLLAFSIKADRQTVPLNETLKIEISDSSRGLDSVDLTGIEAHFEIINRSEQSEYSMVNGRTESRQKLVLTLAPREIGSFVIPALIHKRKSTRPLSIDVVAAVLPPATLNDASIFLEASLDKTEAYVGEQVIYSLAIYYRVGLSNAELSNLQLPDTEVTPLEDKSYQRTINGQRYQIVEKRFAVFFNDSGMQTISGQTLSALIGHNNRSRFGFDPFSRGREVKLAAEPVSLQVKPAPVRLDAISGEAVKWLPAAQLEISDSWSDSANLVAGEPLSRSVKLFAKGLPSSALPDFELPATDDINTYAEKPQLNDQEWHGGIAGQREESIVYIPTRAGRFTFPAYQMQWFNTDTQQWETATLAEKTLVIAANPAAGTDQPVIASPTDRHVADATDSTRTLTGTGAGFSDALHGNTDSPHHWAWPLASGLLLVGWLVTGWFYVRLRQELARQQQPSYKSEDSSWDHLSRKLLDDCRCSNTELSTLNNSLNQWHSALQHRLSGINTTTVDAELRSQLEELEMQRDHINAILYGKEQQAAASDDLEALASVVKQIKRQLNKHHSGESATALKSPARLEPLYPLGSTG